MIQEQEHGNGSIQEQEYGNGTIQEQEHGNGTIQEQEHGNGTIQEQDYGDETVNNQRPDGMAIAVMCHIYCSPLVPSFVLQQVKVGLCQTLR